MTGEGAADPRLRPPAAVRWTAFVLWAACVWLVSSRSHPERDLGWPWRVPDKLSHGTEFAVGGFLGAAALATCLARRSPALAAVLVCSAWGFADEVHQGFVPDRETDAADLAADAAGAAAGAALHALLARRAGRPVRPSR